MKKLLIALGLLSIAFLFVPIIPAQTGPTKTSIFQAYVLPGGAKGDLLYVNSASGDFVRLPIGATGSNFTVDGGVPVWQSPTPTPTVTPTAPTSTPTNTPTNTPTPTVTPTPPTGVSSGEVLWQKIFFTDNSLLPTTMLKDSITSWPAFDSTASSTGHVWSNGLAYELDTSTSAAANSGNAGWWDIGATKAVVLIVVGGMGQGGTTAGQVAIFAGSGVPIATATKSAYEFIFLNNNGGFAIYKTDASGNYTQVSVYGAAGTMAAQTRADSYPIGAALRVDGGAHTEMAFLKMNTGQWIRILSSTDTALSSFRYVGVRTTQSNTTTPIHSWFVAPVEVWYTP